MAIPPPRTVVLTIRPPLNRSDLPGLVRHTNSATPLSLHTHNPPPAGRSTNPRIGPSGNPSFAVKNLNSSPRIRARPSPVATHSAPSRASKIPCTSLAANLGFVPAPSVKNPFPSNRTSPSSVPIHKNPLLAASSACTVFCGSPFSIVHACLPIRATGVVGSSARALTDQPNPSTHKSPAAHTLAHTRCTLTRILKFGCIVEIRT